VLSAVNLYASEAQSDYLLTIALADFAFFRIFHRSAIPKDLLLPVAGLMFVAIVSLTSTTLFRIKLSTRTAKGMISFFMTFHLKVKIIMKSLSYWGKTLESLARRVNPSVEVVSTILRAPFDFANLPQQNRFCKPLEKKGFIFFLNYS
jgi:hypothetical protein